MSEQQFYVVAAILAVLLLLAAVAVAMAGRTRSKPVATHAETRNDKPAPDWLKNVAGGAGKAVTQTSRAVTHPGIDAILVVHDPEAGEWLVEVNGMRYRQLNDIHDDRAAHKVLEALGGLQRFAGSIPLFQTAQPANSAGADQNPTPALHPPRGASVERPAKPALPIEGPLHESVAQAMSDQARASSEPRFPAPPNSIIDQIEKVLQRNLLKRPELESYGIHLGAAADGSLLIEVGWQVYAKADEVPDPVIRNLIKESIQEWERTT